MGSKKTQKQTRHREIFPHSLHLSVRSSDGAARIFCTTSFPSFLYHSAGIRTHVCKVEPDWDVWRMLNGLSYSAAAPFREVFVKRLTQSTAGCRWANVTVRAGAHWFVLNDLTVRSRGTGISVSARVDTKPVFACSVVRTFIVIGATLSQRRFSCWRH